MAARGIEIGHVFQLGRKYAEALGLTRWAPTRSPSASPWAPTASASRGWSRPIAEQSADADGLVWPRSVSPFDVHLVVAGKSEEIVAGAEDLAAALDAVGLRVLLDDRKASPGGQVRRRRADRRAHDRRRRPGLAEGRIEIKDRRSGTREEIPLVGAVEHLTGLVRD